MSKLAFGRLQRSAVIWPLASKNSLYANCLQPIPRKLQFFSYHTTAADGTSTAAETTGKNTLSKKRKPKMTYNIPEPYVPPPGLNKDYKPERLQKIPEDWENRVLPEWKRRLYLTRKKLGGAAWNPRKKLSPEARKALRAVKDLVSVFFHI